MLAGLLLDLDLLGQVLDGRRLRKGCLGLGLARPLLGLPPSPRSFGVVVLLVFWVCLALCPGGCVASCLWRVESASRLVEIGRAPMKSWHTPQLEKQKSEVRNEIIIICIWGNWQSDSTLSFSRFDQYLLSLNFW